MKLFMKSVDCYITMVLPIKVGDFEQDLEIEFNGELLENGDLDGSIRLFGKDLNDSDSKEIIDANWDRIVNEVQYKDSLYIIRLGSDD